jgi:hypothetical protein
MAGGRRVRRAKQVGRRLIARSDTIRFGRGVVRTATWQAVGPRMVTQPGPPLYWLGDKVAFPVRHHDPDRARQPRDCELGHRHV